MIILASTSPYRKKLLSQLGLRFRCQAPEVDETLVKEQMAESPEICAQALARLKAQAILSKGPSDIVIGADQICYCEGKIYSQPGDHDTAIAQLSSLAGKTHQLYTAVCLIMPREMVEFITTSSLTMRSLRPEEIIAYVALDRPYFCAGSYMIEERGICLFSKIDTQDFSSIIGLPLMELTQHLGLEEILINSQKNTHT